MDGYEFDDYGAYENDGVRPETGPCEGRGCSREDTPQAGTWCEEARAYLCASCRPDFDFAPTEGL